MGHPVWAPRANEGRLRRRPTIGVFRLASRKQRAREPLVSDLAALHDLSHNELKERWSDLFGSACPLGMSRNILVRAIAYRIQERALGGLDSSIRRRLDRASADLAAGRPPALLAPKIKPGTRLLREWQGNVHEVIVLEKGVEYRGRSWPSLSAVAREITGTRWSGPRFFGLKGVSPNGRA
jgi:Protein of unknown function (DUF2924)